MTNKKQILNYLSDLMLVELGLDVPQEILIKIADTLYESSKKREQEILDVSDLWDINEAKNQLTIMEELKKEVKTPFFNWLVDTKIEKTQKAITAIEQVFNALTKSYDDD